VSAYRACPALQRAVLEPSSAPTSGTTRSCASSRSRRCLEHRPPARAGPAVRGGAPHRRRRRRRSPPRSQRHDLGKGLIEYIVTGTAIRLPNSDGRDGARCSPTSPLRSTGSSTAAGYEPVGLVASTAVMFASPPRTTRMRRARQPAQNRELDELSRAFHTARESLRTALRDQTSYAHGTAPLGSRSRHTVHREKLGHRIHAADQDMRGWHRGTLGIPYRVSGRGDAERHGWVITMHRSRDRDPSSKRPVSV